MCAKRGRRSEPAQPKKIPAGIEPLADALEVACNFLQNGDHDGMIIGGVAVALRTRSRHTNDIDLVIWCPDALQAETIAVEAARFGLVLRTPDAIEIAETHRVLLLKHDESGINIDMSLGALEYEHTAISRRSSVTTKAAEVPTASVEDLIVLKTIAGRPQDLQDIRMLAAEYSNLDDEYIFKWIDDLASMADLGDRASEIRRLLADVRRGLSKTRSQPAHGSDRHRKK